MADMDHQNDPTLRVYYSLIKVVRNRPAATVIGDFQSLGAWSLTSLAADVVAEIKKLEGKKEIGALYIAPPELISQCELINRVPDVQVVIEECLRLEWTPTTLHNCAKRVSSKSRLFFLFILSSDYEVLSGTPKDDVDSRVARYGVPGSGNPESERRTIQGLATRGYVVSFHKDSRTSSERYKTAVHAIQRNRVFLKKILEVSEEEHFLKMCKHQNVIRLIESFEMDGATWLVFPLYMSLSTGLVLDPLIIQPHVMGISVDIAQGLDFLHSMKVAHLDVKPDNIVIDKNFTAILIDFETAVCVDERETITGFRGTLGWAASEVQREYQGYNPFLADRYSCGCVFEELSRVHPGACNLRAFSKVLMHVYPTCRPPLQDWIQCNISEPAIAVVGNTAEETTAVETAVEGTMLKAVE